MADKQLARVLDANINRAKEGLRVCEEITRFILGDTALTKHLKNCRHKIDRATAPLVSLKERLLGRSSSTDIGKQIFLRSEFKRAGTTDIFFANIQRVKESLRVLEEFAKLSKKHAAAAIKKIRYDTYEIEKKVITKFGSLRDTRRGRS